MKRRHHGFGDTFYIDEVFVKIGGQQHYLWHAVDQDGEVVEDSSHPDRLNDSWMFMPLCTTFSTLAVIWCQLAIVGN